MNINNLIRGFNDWRRGYTDKDLKTLNQKLTGPFKPGQWVKVTNNEMNAYSSMRVIIDA